MFIKLTVVVVLANRTQLPNVGSCIRKDVTDDDNINDDDDVEGNLVEHRLVTDTDTDTGPWLVPRMHSIAR